MASESMLEVDNLAVTIDHEEVLKDISFRVQKGEILAIIGPNGAGKTVLFRSLLGLQPHRGKVRWQPRVKIGYVPQKLAVDRSVPITAREFFLLKSPHFWLTPKSYIDHLHHELSLVNLGERLLDKPLAELSGGQFQRLMIAWAMVNHPDVLLFDEPTAGIDIASETAIYDIVQKLQDERQTTVLLITHDFRVVEKYADRVLGLNREVVCFGTPKEALQSKVLEQLFGLVQIHHPHAGSEHEVHHQKSKEAK